MRNHSARFESCGAAVRMWTWRLLVACAVTLGWAPTSAAASELLEVERYSLDNGLDVVLHVDRRLPRVAVNLSYHVGAMHDGERRGLAHLVEHVMFRGTSHMGDGELHSRLQDAGAQRTNASTRDAATSYETVIPSDRLALALWLESDRMEYTRAALSASAISEEIDTTIDEWEFRVQSEPGGNAFVSMWSTVFGPDHPLVLASPEQIRRLQVDDVREVLWRYYGPANATLVLVGDLPPDVHELIERYFGHRDGGERPADPVLVVPRARKGRHIVRRAELATNPRVLLAWPSPASYAPGDAEADVLAANLGAHRLAALAEAHAPDTFLDLRVQQFSSRGQSLFMISAYGTSTATPEHMLEALDEVLDDVRHQPMLVGDVRRARRRLTVGMLRGLNGLDARAARMQQYIAHGKPPDWLDEDLARYAAVDELSVLAFVRDYLGPNQRVVITAVPPNPEEVAQ